MRFLILLQELPIWTPPPLTEGLAAITRLHVVERWFSLKHNKAQTFKKTPKANNTYTISVWSASLYSCICIYMQKGSGTYPCALLSRQFLTVENTKKNTSA